MLPAREAIDHASAKEHRRKHWRAIDHATECTPHIDFPSTREFQKFAATVKRSGVEAVAGVYVGDGDAVGTERSFTVAANF